MNDLNIEKIKQLAKDAINSDVASEDSDAYMDAVVPWVALALIEQLEKVTKERDSLAAQQAELLLANRHQKPVVNLHVENGRIEDVLWQGGLMAYPDGNVMLYARPMLSAPAAITDDLAYQILTLALRNGTREAFPDKLRKLLDKAVTSPDSSENEAQQRQAGYQELDGKLAEATSERDAAHQQAATLRDALTAVFGTDDLIALKVLKANYQHSGPSMPLRRSHEKIIAAIDALIATHPDSNPENKA